MSAEHFGSAHEEVHEEVEAHKNVLVCIGGVVERSALSAFDLMGMANTAHGHAGCLKCTLNTLCGHGRAEDYFVEGRRSVSLRDAWSLPMPRSRRRGSCSRGYEGSYDQGREGGTPFRPFAPRSFPLMTARRNGENVRRRRRILAALSVRESALSAVSVRGMCLSASSF